MKAPPEEGDLGVNARLARVSRQDAEKILQQRTRSVQTLNTPTEVLRWRRHLRGLSVRQDPLNGRMAPRSAVGTSSGLLSLRPCPRNGASWCAGVGRVSRSPF